ncbi:DUF4326 domain-containing protein [Methylobacter tundripaludum]|uniref:DUF4326 domain-containing protein n=1 Tax=Methylobacter tundripaludum TaxID=173365 RepID=UPI001C66F138
MWRFATRNHPTELYKLAGKKLGCFCKPEDCHGDILASRLGLKYEAQHFADPA